MLITSLQRRVLTASEWGGLVQRLNESGKDRKRHLLRAQHEQIANELAGFNFTPQINPKVCLSMFIPFFL